MYGYGTCKDEESRTRTSDFAKLIQRLIHDLQQAKQLSRQDSRLSTDSKTTSRNIDTIATMLGGNLVAPAPIAEHGPGGDDSELYDGNGDKVDPALSKAPSVSKTPTVASHLTKHVPILPPKNTTQTISEEMAEKITHANLKRHRNSIAVDADAIPAELRWHPDPKPIPTGTDGDYDSTVATMGHLEVVQQREAIKPDADKGSNPAFSKPSEVKHTQHVSFGKDGFKGIPEEWAIELQKQFSVEITQLPSSNVTGYTGKIPFVLQTLRDLLVDKGGMSTIGIFRIAPEQKENDQAKADIDKGLLLSMSAPRDEDGKLIFEYEVHVVSNLIKVWLRELPTPLLHHVNKQRLEACATPEDAIAIMDALPDPFKSVCQYLMDFLSVVASRQAENKMSPQNLAICFCPNLFKGNPNDQMATLVFTQKISKWFTIAIQYRLDNPRQDEDESLQMLYSTESAKLLPAHIPKASAIDNHHF